MATKIKDRPKARSGHDSDLYSWVQEQVALLKAGRLDEIDADNIAEELRDVGNSEYAQLESALRVLIMHMLKWDQQPEFRTRSWVFTIAEQRDRYAVVLRKNPGLKQHLETMRSDVYRSARRWAANETNLHESEFPRECPYDWDDLLSRPFETDSVPAPK
ncbi:DUF29 domain-containing protein [Hansschlegelia zhihuaiae]|uniref:DUF29 domain-containing protein n=1 Tax=Hansschlegelia zhihuaiae TaxID=405005 RepID=A0A4Q0MQY4_9HYPH|nr:DUF29 domain-containing protein [Hansschlegelia zhihuaiae]RXF75639.1 DUF29 domain-containing protein [Hansschlegelia zhihuaiae]